LRKFGEMEVARGQRQDDIERPEAERFELRLQRTGIVDHVMAPQRFAPRSRLRA
jgi:hypothetical protein